MSRRRKNTRNIELRLISELMKNSHRSDRELARTLKTSQPTVTRTRTRLEKEGHLREYTVIPDFHKLGFQLASVNFVSLKKGLSKTEWEKAQEIQMKNMAQGLVEEIVLFNRGLGGNYNAVVVAVHRDYSDYSKFIGKIQASPYVDGRLGFLVDLSDKTQYRPFTFSTLAKHLLTMSE